jgi:hypothetical protein
MADPVSRASYNGDVFEDLRPRLEAAGEKLANVKEFL